MRHIAILGSCSRAACAFSRTPRPCCTEGDDGRRCLVAIACTKFDDRAFEINDEITVSFLDGCLAGELEQIFERDLKDCVELKLETCSRRGALHKPKDHFF